MKKALLCISILSIVFWGCTSDTGSTGSPTAPSTSVTFNITNNLGNSSVYVTQVFLTQNSTATNYSQNCNIASGATVSVTVNGLPAGGGYLIDIVAANNGYIWNNYNLTLGSTYSVVLTVQSKTLNGAQCDRIN